MNLLTIHPAELASGVWTVSLRGSLDASNVEAFGATAREVLEKGARHVLLDLKDAVYVSSSGFSSFLKIADLAAERGGRILFVGTPPRIKEIFKILGLIGALTFASDEGAALAYLASLSGDSVNAPLSEPH